MGKPASKEFSPYEIFSSYTVWLSERRLKEVGLWDQYSEQYHDNIKRLETKHGLISFENDFKKMIYDAADPFFTWERAAGMCPVCNGVWLSLLSGIFFYTTHDTNFDLLRIFVHLLLIVLVSHIVIRILSKII